MGAEEKTTKKQRYFSAAHPRRGGHSPIASLYDDEKKFKRRESRKKSDDMGSLFSESRKSNEFHKKRIMSYSRCKDIRVEDSSDLESPKTGKSRKSDIILNEDLASNNMTRMRVWRRFKKQKEINTSLSSRGKS